MASPRKAWFRVADSVLRENWNNDQLACFVRLLAFMNQRWARDGLDPDEACEVELGLSDIELISGKRRRDVAATSLERLANVGGMFVERRGDVIAISWPKYAEFQNLPAGRRATVAPTRSHTPTPPPTPPPTQKKKRRARARACLFPEGGIPESDRLRLVAWGSEQTPALEPAAIDHAIARVDDWSRSRGQKRADWPATIRNGITAGWALEGFTSELPPSGPRLSNASQVQQDAMAAVLGEMPNVESDPATGAREPAAALGSSAVVRCLPLRER